MSEQGGAHVADKKIYIKLFGGEQDGYDTVVDGDQAPTMFYVHRVHDDKRISDAKNPDLRATLADALAVLAYELDIAYAREGVPGGLMYRYNRRESADKSLHDPAV